jgi:hypothetical protein
MVPQIEVLQGAPKVSCSQNPLIDINFDQGEGPTLDTHTNEMTEI